MYSDTSLLQGIPPWPMLRDRTSPPIIKVMPSTSSAATAIRPSSKAPYQRESTAIFVPRLSRARLLRKECLQFRPMLRALPHYAGPPRLVGLGAKILAQRNDFDARRLLLGDIGLVLLGNIGGLRLDPGGGIGDDLLLPIVQLGPGVLVDEDADLGAVEARIDPIFGLFVPAQVENARD